MRIFGNLLDSNKNILGVPPVTYRVTTADQTTITTLVDLTGLVGIVFPEDPDGVKQFRINAHFQLMSEGSNIDTQLNAYVNGTGLSAGGGQVLNIKQRVTANDEHSIDIAGFHVTPAAFTKLGFAATSSNSLTILGASPTFSWVEIVRIPA